MAVRNPGGGQLLLVRLQSGEHKDDIATTLNDIISCSVAHLTASHYNAGTWQSSTAPAFPASDMPAGRPHPALALAPLPMQRSHGKPHHARFRSASTSK